MRTHQVNCSWNLFGAGVIAIAVECLFFHCFYLIESTPVEFPGRPILVVLGALVVLLGGAAVQWRRFAAVGGALIAGYFLVVVIVLLNAAEAIEHWREYGIYENLAEQFAISAAALVIFAEQAVLNAQIDDALRLRLIQLARRVFACCAIVFGGAHFVYVELTWPLVPAWLPPSQLFWAYATGVAHIAAGLAVLFNVRPRLAMLLLAVMYASFTPLIHLPMLLDSPSSQFLWSENAVNIALAGVAFVIAESYRPLAPLRSHNRLTAA